MSRRLLDLHYYQSRAMYYDLDKKELLSDEESKEIYKRWRELKHIGFIEPKDGIKVDVLRDGKPFIVNGRIYEE